MAKITALSRCAGQNHLHFTIQRTNGTVHNLTIEQADLNIEPSGDDEYLRQRLSLLGREAKAAGATTYAQIRTYLLNREWVE
jgi:hypothetical protein